MPFVKKIETEIGVLGIWELTETSSSLLCAFNFSENEKIEFSKIKFEKRKCEYLATRLLLESLLKEKTEITYLSSRKPILKNNPLNISISHSANLVVVLTSAQKVGIDVEIENRSIDKVVHRFLSQTEMLDVEKAMNKQKAKIIYWGAKESIFKTTDFNGVQFDRQISISPFKLKTEGYFFGKLTTEEIAESYKLWYFSYQNNSIVYCVEV